MSILRYMIKKNILILGASGQIGRHLIRKFTKNNYKAICQTRNAHKSVFLKTSGSIGYIDIVEADIFDQDLIDKLLSKSDICINLIGILYEKNKKNSFKNIHTYFPDVLSRLCKKNNNSLIHFSALGVENAKDSNYAKSKYEGENRIKNNLESAVIIKPSIVFSVSDSFSTNFLSLFNYLPIFPLYYNGMTKFTPIHASEVADLIYHVVSNDISSKVIEALGPDVLTFKEMLEILLNSINKKRLLLPLPLPIAKLSTSILEKFPKPLITKDQLRLLKYDNVKTSGGLTNFDIGSPSKIKFKEGVMKYAYNWMDGGQYSIINRKN